MINPTNIHNNDTTPDQLMSMDPVDYREHWLLSAFADCTFFGNNSSSSFSSSFSSNNNSRVSTELSVEDAETIANLMSETDNNNNERNQRQSSSHPLQHQQHQQRWQHKQRKEINSTPIHVEKSPTSTSTPSSTPPSTSASTSDATDLDILCGQSRNCACHPGNRKFQSLLDSYVPKYMAASNKQEKMFLTKEIVGCITSTGGKFLKYNPDEKVWQEISTIASRDKVSHALRTKVASWNKKQLQKQKRKEHGKQEESKRRQEKRSTNIEVAIPNASNVASRISTTATTKLTKTKSEKPKRKTHRRGQQQIDSSFSSTNSDILTASFDANDPTVPSIQMDSFSIEI